LKDDPGRARLSLGSLLQEAEDMIAVTRLNGSKLHINALLIETVEETPDTIITLTNGKKFIVSEKSSEVIRSIRHYLRSIGVLTAITSKADTLSEGAST
jgi:flagellar protein FlbD